MEISVGLEVIGEAKFKGITHKAIQTATGIPDKSFRRWFVETERHIPFEELQKVADALRVSVSELVSRAEANVDKVMDRMDEDKMRALAADKALTDVERADLQKVIDERWPSGGSSTSVSRRGTGT